MDWARRSEKAELIDSPESVPPQRMELVLQELRQVNRFLGGAHACLKAATPVLRRLADKVADRPLHVADWGTGSADLPRALIHWAAQEGVRLQIFAVDFNLHACRHASRLLDGAREVSVLAGDVFHPPFAPGRIDVVLFSAFLHHFSREQILTVLRQCREAGVAWVVINDLHRSRAAYLGIRLLTALFSNSPEIRHDGPLSVRKGFRRSELREIARSCGCRRFEISWQWAFRYSMLIQFETKAPAGV